MADEIAVTSLFAKFEVLHDDAVNVNWVFVSFELFGCSALAFAHAFSSALVCAHAFSLHGTLVFSA